MAQKNIIKHRQSSAPHRSNDTTPPPPPVYPGDDIIPNAPMTYNQHLLLPCSPETVWPWLVQLGKARGGWYLRHRYESRLPAHWRASRTIEPQWQDLKVGDRIPDYGGQQDYLEVVSIEAPTTLIYRSERYGTTFSWALLLEPEGAGSKLHLRFRGGVRSEGLRRWVIVKGGGWLDWLSTRPMLAGLAERICES